MIEAEVFKFIVFYVVYCVKFSKTMIRSSKVQLVFINGIVVALLIFEGLVCYAGQTALHLAVQHCNLQAVMSLINAGARVDARDSTNGRTPLSYAVQQDDRRATKILLASGANASLFSYSELYSAPLAVGPPCRTRMARPLDAYVTTDVKG